jgi:hypothetical protein
LSAVTFMDCCPFAAEFAELPIDGAALWRAGARMLSPRR